jgi:glycosyltransferase involved in cell wall biosynthesis
MERPNTHTRHAYEVVADECRRLGVTLPKNDSHAYNESVLELEEREFAASYRLLCPSKAVVRSFLERGFAAERLAEHFYGFDHEAFTPAAHEPDDTDGGLTMLFAGSCAVRKGVHFALEAWLRSTAHERGKFRIAGDFLPDYQRTLAPMLEHPSVEVLGHRSDMPELMRQSHVLVLPSIEEGFGLVCVEAMGSGCVPLVSDACTEFCRHMENSLVHRVGDVDALTEHLDLLDRDRALLSRLRESGLRGRDDITWDAAGRRLVEVYEETIDMHRSQRRQAPPVV